VKLQIVKLTLVLGYLLAGTCSESARGDGGTVRLSKCEGGYRISVFTMPTPFRAGPVDISVLVQDAVTGEPIPAVQVTIRLTARDRAVEPIVHAATTTAATNKLLRAAVFELPEPGHWAVEVTTVGRLGPVQVCFELMAADRAPKWPAIWPWIGWPAPVILLFLIHQLLIWRRSRRLD
jgi:hypothetical protein